MPGVEIYISELSHHPAAIWALSLCLAILFAVILRSVAGYFSKKISILTDRTQNQWDNLLPQFLNKISFWFLFVWSLLSLLSMFQVEGAGVAFVRGATVVLTCWQIGLWGFLAIKGWYEKFLLIKIKQDTSSAAALELFYTATKSLFVIALGLIALSNLGVNVGALLTGLGIGGIAVALAAQNILGDLLSSLSIALDKPFVMGDYIVAGDDEGTVEHIGIKTTRVRSISGEELIFSNKDLLESRVRNYKRMWRRRVSHSFSVPFDTDTQKVRLVPEWIKEIAKNLSKMSFDRCHLRSYNDSVFNFELVFWIEDTDYKIYMDLQEKLLLLLTDKMKSEGISLALPVRRIHIDSITPIEMKKQNGVFHEQPYQL